MANTANGAVNISFVNADWIPPSGSSGNFLSSSANYGSISALRGRLTTLNAAYYTSARLDSMTVNDMVYALRSIDDRTTISSIQPVSTA